MSSGQHYFDIPNVGKTPCLNCEERDIGCHSHCEMYIAWKKKLDTNKKLYYKQKQENKIIYKGDFLGDEGLMNNSKFRSIKKRYKR